MICEKEKCTACNACINICPKGCIHFVFDEIDVHTAEIEEEQCIHCGMCYKVCPQLNEMEASTPSRCYAAWSNNADIRKFAASGGIATEICRYFAENDGFYTGVRLTDAFEAEYVLSDDITLLSEIRNSKYVYSDTKQVYEEIAKKLPEKKIVFIGLPCQVDALKRYLSLKRVDTSELLTVDLICHGSMPYEYLRQHIKKIEIKYRKKTTKLYFRDPNANTYTYTFSMSDDDKLFYQRKVHRNDAYQIAYHYGLAYRENCYSCRYARPERVGDLTLGDFSYVGAKAPCAYDNKKVSCILVNTAKGQRYLSALQKEDKIFLEQRPIEEELLYEKQLQRPTAKRTEREKFIEIYKKTDDFDSAVESAAQAIIRKNEMYYYFHIKQIKRIIKRIIPTFLLQKFKII